MHFTGLSGTHVIFFFFCSADRKRTEKMSEAKKIKTREDNIRARAEAKKANKGKRGKPVSDNIYIPTIL